MTIMEFTMDTKGRVTVPAAARAAAGLAPGQIRGRVEAGRIVLETAEAVQRRIWSRASGGPLQEGSSVEVEVERAALALGARERTIDGPPIDDVGQQLLTDLGL